MSEPSAGLDLGGPPPQLALEWSPALQQDLRKRGAVRLAQTIAYNDYLLVGPKRDPARA